MMRTNFSSLPSGVATPCRALPRQDRPLPTPSHGRPAGAGPQGRDARRLPRSVKSWSRAPSRTAGRRDWAGAGLEEPLNLVTATRLSVRAVVSLLADDVTLRAWVMRGAVEVARRRGAKLPKQRRPLSYDYSFLADEKVWLLVRGEDFPEECGSSRCRSACAPERAATATRARRVMRSRRGWRSLTPTAGRPTRRLLQSDQREEWEGVVLLAFLWLSTRARPVPATARARRGGRRRRALARPARRGRRPPERAPPEPSAWAARQRRDGCESRQRRPPRHACARARRGDRLLRP